MTLKETAPEARGGKMRDLDREKYTGISPLSQVLARLQLQGVRRSGDGWLAHCPAHQDDRASLSITEGEDGRVLLHCHAGCPTGRVVAALGLRMSDLFPQGGRGHSQPARRIVATYDYTDAEGRVLFQVVRFAPKEFRLRQPDRAAPGGWAWNLDGVEPVLYRLPEVVEAVRAGRTVFVCEGEKDCNNLAALGLSATTCPMGAGKWRESYSEALAGADVVVLPDNDEPGRHHAQQVAESLHRHGCRVKVLELPGLPPKGDVSDWLAAGGTKTELLQLLEAAGVWQPPAQEEAPEAAPEAPKLPKQAVLLVELALSAGAELFRDATGQAFARLPVGGHLEIWPIGRSGVFRQWLLNLFWDSMGGPPQPEAVNQALERLAGLAYRGPCHRLSNRVAWHGDAIWFDLSDPDWRAVRVTASGWQIVNDPPILFRRYQHQAPQVEPVPGGCPRELLDFVNVQDEEQRQLLLVYAISCLVPDIPHPELMIYGPQGSAKSTLHAMLKKLIDPSVVRVLSESKDKAELVQKLSHHWYAPFDNLSTLPAWEQDCFSRACTGEGDSKRQLYTDDEDFLYTYRCCVGINGINLVATKPDLLDRAIILELEAIPKHRRRPEALLWRSFEEARPRILGGMLDALCRAMAIRPEVKLDHYFRLADFTAWGYAIAEAIGWEGEKFLRTYGQNVEQVQEEVLHGHPVAAAVTAFMRSQKKWEGSPSVLLQKLERVAEAERIDTRIRLWPKAAHALTRRLNEVKTNLAAAGLRVLITREGHGGERRVVLESAKEASPASPEAPCPSSMAFDGDALGDAFGSKGGGSVTQSVTLKTRMDTGGDAGDAGDGIFGSPREEGMEEGVIE